MAIVKKSTVGEGFTRVLEDLTYRLVYRSIGAEKTGKNHFGLTGPGPILIQCFDILGVQNTVEKFVRQGKDVFIKKYKFVRGQDASQAQAQDIRAEFSEDFQTALDQGFRSVQWDESELWQTCTFAEFGKTSDRANKYEPLYAFYRELIHRVDDYAVNLQLIQKVKEQWDNVKGSDGIERGKPSGRMVPYGMKEVGYIVDTNLSHSWNKEEGFVIDIVNCRANMAMSGERLTNTNFPELATMVFGEESEGSWS